MTELSLAAHLASAPNPVRALRNVPLIPFVFPGLVTEFTNWRSEQRVWHESAALLDQSHHMTDLFVEGPEALRLFQGLAVNSFARFPVGSAKQFIATNAEGQLVGDAILVRLDEERFDLIGEPVVVAWVQFHIESGDFDVTFHVDQNSLIRSGPPEVYRFELQGPTALRVLEAATGAPVPATKFFHIEEFTIAGRRVQGIRHGMAGQPGYELFGPWADREDVRAALLAAGAEHGIQPVGSTAYFTANAESGWLGIPMPAIFSGESTRAFREWLPAAFAGALGGSFDSEDIEDYYYTPYDVGYGQFISFDHDFVGKDALAQLADQPARRKVTLIWNDEDFANVFQSLVRPEEGLPAQLIQPSAARYALYQPDRVLADGKTVGLQLDPKYISTDQRFVSIAVIDAEYAEPGTELTVIWGDSLTIPRSQVEPHRQVEVRVTVAPVPYAEFAREQYRR